ncbi:MAG: hypothetical protein KO206_04495 [Methanomicrobiaceae archaeon]|nr:hypothetical protein [Methanomicrobiaceae archaeon]
MIKKKVYFTFLMCCLIVFDTIIVGCLFLGVWALERLAKLLGIHSWGFFVTISHISEIGLIVLYVIFVIMSIIISVVFLKEEITKMIEEV